jgi:FtsH-binding integral membrane protein
MAALVIVIVASVIGLFIQAPLLWTIISVVSAILFSAFLVIDLNRVARTQGVRGRPSCWLLLCIWTFTTSSSIC